VSYVNLDCSFYTHPKVTSLGRDHDAMVARSVYLGALMYCRTHLTDGHIPHDAARHLDPLVTEVDALKALERCRIEKLVTRRRGRFGGWKINNYEMWQQTKEEVEAAKAAARARKRREREKKRGTPGHAVTAEESRCDISVTGEGVTPIEREREREEELKAVYAKSARERETLDRPTNSLRLINFDNIFGEMP
jgi:hypothetical protein